MCVCTSADLCTDEEVEHDVLEEPGLQPDPLPHDHPHRPLLRHHVPPEGAPPQVRYGTFWLTYHYVLRAFFAVSSPRHVSGPRHKSGCCCCLIRWTLLVQV